MTNKEKDSYYCAICKGIPVDINGYPIYDLAVTYDKRCHYCKKTYLYNKE